MKDPIGDRIKANYEDRTRYSLPRRTHSIIRLDGKSFHTFTKGFKRPFDERLMFAMDATAQYLCENIQGAQFAYTQSDEISILVTDFASINSEAWFDGNIQKIVSVSASMATIAFHSYLSQALTFTNPKPAFFDSRTFTIPDPIEVYNYFIWRNQDCSRNSVSSLAQSVFSSTELHGKNMKEQKDMLFIRGMDWENYKEREKYGSFVARNSEGQWVINDAWRFMQAPSLLQSYIPKPCYEGKNPLE